MSGGIYFKEFNTFAASQWVGFTFGIVVIFTGLFLLSPDDMSGGDEEKKSLVDDQTGIAPWTSDFDASANGGGDGDGAAAPGDAATAGDASGGGAADARGEGADRFDAERPSSAAPDFEDIERPSSAAPGKAAVRRRSSYHRRAGRCAERTRPGARERAPGGFVVVIVCSPRARDTPQGRAVASCVPRTLCASRVGYDHTHTPPSAEGCARRAEVSGGRLQGAPRIHAEGGV